MNTAYPKISINSKKDAIYEWHRWFAWYPVTTNGKWAFFNWIFRRRMQSCGGYGEDWWYYRTLSLQELSDLGFILYSQDSGPFWSDCSGVDDLKYYYEDSFYDPITKREV